MDPPLIQMKMRYKNLAPDELYRPFVYYRIIQPPFSLIEKKRTSHIRAVYFNGARKNCFPWAN
jgi:hypothetical protein